ncbi:MAG: aldo/keto reductase [Deltaproteobacteria bacterium]|nr:aldo/keto reductase [Deltaproteobacteria bacterium]MBW2363171.1 aldo/keto reductase [Deltaproteobacteria bacterium]
MQGIPTTRLGQTGLEVTRLGFGAMELAPIKAGLTPEGAGRVLRAVLDGGINFIDTSPDYGLSEEMIGEHIAGRRDEFVLASKCGCPIDVEPSANGVGAHVYTPENIRAGVEQSLKRMRTDHIDIVQIHMSPSRAVLEKDGAVDSLRELQGEGKLRFIGISGVLPDLDDHIAMGVFDSFQIPYSVLQREHEEAIARAARAGSGIIIRGGVARGAPAPDKEPDEQLEFFRPAMQERRDAWQTAGLDELLDGSSRMEFLLRFTLSQPDIHTTIVGTASTDHLAANLVAARAGPLPDDVIAEARRRLQTSTPA